MSRVRREPYHEPIGHSPEVFPAHRRLVGLALLGIAMVVLGWLAALSR